MLMDGYHITVTPGCQQKNSDFSIGGLVPRTGRANRQASTATRTVF